MYQPHPGSAGLFRMPPPPHPSIRWAFTQRQGGFSRGAWGAGQSVPAAPPGLAGSAPPAQPALPPMAGEGGLNLGDHCGDDPQAVARNRQLVARMTGQPVSWLTQVHGRTVIELQAADIEALARGCDPDGAAGMPRWQADAQISSQPGAALAVLVADCLPVLLADRQGRVIGAAHAGWRGLAAGVLEATVARMCRHAAAADLVAWLGPCIGPDAFEVGDEVRQAFIAGLPAADAAFRPAARPGKWLADLPALARQRLQAAGVGSILAAAACTHTDARHFWSYRRDPCCGRMAGLVWFESAGASVAAAAPSAG